MAKSTFCDRQRTGASIVRSPPDPPPIRQKVIGRVSWTGQAHGVWCPHDPSQGDESTRSFMAPGCEQKPRTLSRSLQITQKRSGWPSSKSLRVPRPDSGHGELPKPRPRPEKGGGVLLGEMRLGDMIAEGLCQRILV